ncbi:MAG TPA: DUF4176 domain-containing protein [Bacillaceae bacterium]
MNEIDVNSLKIRSGNELLPIGSVVLIEPIPQALMIYGRTQQQAGKEGIWDYVACPYPQGHLSDETNVFFNHSQIEEVVFKGLETEGEKALREKLQHLFNRDVSYENS